MVQIEQTIKVTKCQKCGYMWVSRTPNPKGCPLCHFRFDYKYKTPFKQLQYNCRYRVLDQRGNGNCIYNENAPSECKRELCPLLKSEKGEKEPAQPSTPNGGN